MSTSFNTTYVSGVFPQPNGYIEDSGEYIHVMMNGNRHFLARFKYSRRDKRGFISFLKKNFTVEEYLSAMEVRENSPVSIMEAKGYVSATIKSLLKENGLPQTLDGYKSYCQSIARSTLL